MTNKTTMPDPVAWYHPSDYGFDSSFRDHSTILACTGNTWEGFLPLITTDQAEAYADAKVREALEEAAEIADQHNDFSTYDAIRALIPKEQKT